MEDSVSIFSPENIIAILSIAVSVVLATIGGIYTVITNTKKYELTENYRCELLSWYSNVIEIMIVIIHHCKTGEFFEKEFVIQRSEYLSKLSALAEKGRFYFPNIIRNDGYGKNKPSAYQGYRHICLEYILNFYFTANSPTISENQINLMWKYERRFTSFIFDMINPKKYNKQYKKYLTITLPKGEILEDYIYDFLSL